MVFGSVCLSVEIRLEIKLEIRLDHLLRYSTYPPSIRPSTSTRRLSLYDKSALFPIARD